MPRILHRDPDGLRLLGLPLGLPQSIAALLLLLFFLQAMWLVQRLPISQAERAFIREGRLHWQQRRVAGDEARGPLAQMLAAAPIQLWRGSADDFSLPPVLRLARLPFVLVGLLLGASIWYVARRLYANPGGYIALALFATSPALLAAGAAARPEVLVAWGLFGVVFTAIAAAHSLYGPPEAALGERNARRLAMLGLAIALAVGAQYSAALGLPLAVGFMLYLVPGRRLTALAVFGAALSLAFLVLLAAYFFAAPALLFALERAHFVAWTPALLAVGETWSGMADAMARGAPAALLLLAPALAAYAAWPRTRYFGNTAPLAAAVLFLLAGAADSSPAAEAGAQLVPALPFLFVFLAGVFADLLESPYRRPALAALILLLAFQAGYSMVVVARA